MKRAPFLLGGSAAMLAGCGGGRALTQAIPGIGNSSVAHKPGSKVQLVPATPDPIPANVLANPIVGEAARFAGSVAPVGWMFAEGQTLQSSAYSALAQLLGQPNGTLKSSFTLPKAGFPLIIAVTGIQPTSPASLAAARKVSRVAALGLLPGARPAPPRLPKPLSAEALAARRLAQTNVHTTNASPVELSLADRTRITAATADARTAALGALSAATHALLEGAIDDAVAGRSDLHGALVRTAAALDADEITALNVANSSYVRPFNGNWTPDSSAGARLAAASFLLSVAITPQQAQTIGARE
jgi:hypothetical protein